MTDAPSVHNDASNELGDYEIRFEPAAERVRVEFNGTWVADSSKALIVYETRMPPLYYFPVDDVHMDYLEKTDRQLIAPSREMPVIGL